MDKAIVLEVENLMKDIEKFNKSILSLVINIEKAVDENNIAEAKELLDLAKKALNMNYDRMEYLSKLQ